MHRDDSLCKLLDRLAAEGRECEWLEFKENYLDHDYLGKCISAPANFERLHSKEHAYVIFGIQDKALTIVGTKVSLVQEKVGEAEVENWLHVRMKPRLDFRLHEFHYNSKKIVIVEIDPVYDRPVAFGNVAYIRIGSSNNKLSDYLEKERKIWMIGDKLSFEKQMARTVLVEDDVFALLDWERYFELRGLRSPVERKLSLPQLEKENLISRTASLGISNTGALLLVKDLREFDQLIRKTVRTIIYSDKSCLQTTRELEVSRGYAAGFEDLIARIEEQLPAREELGSEGVRKTIKTYPSIAVREIVANLLIHQDFSIRWVRRVEQGNLYAEYVLNPLYSIESERYTTFPYISECMLKQNTSKIASRHGKLLESFRAQKRMSGVCS